MSFFVKYLTTMTETSSWICQVGYFPGNFMNTSHQQQLQQNTDLRFWFVFTVTRTSIVCGTSLASSTNLTTGFRTNTNEAGSVGISAVLRIKHSTKCHTCVVP
jgi:hypothetical protein